MINGCRLRLSICVLLIKRYGCVCKVVLVIVLVCYIRCGWCIYCWVLWSVVIVVWVWLCVVWVKMVFVWCVCVGRKLVCVIMCLVCCDWLLRIVCLRGLSNILLILSLLLSMLLSIIVWVVNWIVRLLVKFEWLRSVFWLLILLLVVLLMWLCWVFWCARCKIVL